MATERNVLVRLSMNENDYVRGAARATLATQNLLSSVDKTNDRTAWLAQGILALAPAAVTMGAAAVPAVVGLTSQMAVAAGAAGVLGIAFNGVGDGLKALNKYQLEPTETNLNKLRIELEKLGPAGTDFILYLDSLSDELRTVRDEARENMFPGVTEGIDAVLDRLPQVRQIIGELANGIGELTSEAGHALAGGDFDAYFQYLDNEARPLLMDLGRTWGNLIEGLANMFVAFAPMTRDFSQGFLDMSRDFSTWAAGLSDNRSFQEFLEYIDRNVPNALDLLGSLVDFFVDLVQALAPIGEQVVPLLTDFLDILGAIVDTPIGTAFLGLAAAMSVYGRAAALASITTGGMFRSFKDLPLVTRTMQTFKDGRPTVRQFGNALLYAGHSSDVLYRSLHHTSNAASTSARNALKARNSVQQFARGVAPAAATVAGMAFAFSDLDDNMGLTNTTMFGLMGMMAGPWGAAVGTAIGFTMDIAAANDEAANAIGKLSDVVSQQPQAFAEQRKHLDAATAAVDEYREAISADSMAESFKEHFTSLKPWQNTIEDLFGTSEIVEQTRALEPLQQQVEINRHAFQRLHYEMADGKQVGYLQDLEQLEDVARRMGPAMDALQITPEDLSEANADTLRGYVAAMERWNRANESAGGRARNVGKAIDALDDEMLTATESADLLQQALDQLLTGQDAEAAFDQYKESVRALRKELEALGPAGENSFKGSSKAALENRSLTRDAARDIINMLGTQAKAGASSAKLARLLRDARLEFIREGVAAGISRKEMERRAEVLELTPKLVETVFKQVGMDKAKADIKKLLDDYDLTPKQKQTIINAIDRATPVIRRVQMAMGDLKDKTVTIRVNRAYGTATAHVEGQHGRFTREADGGLLTRSTNKGLVNAYADGGVATSIARAPSIGSQQPQVRPYSGPGGILWSELGSGPWEAFISGHPAKRDRSRGIADDVVSRLGGQIQWFANGGLLEQRRGWGAAGSASVDFPDHVLSKLATHMAAIAPMFGQATFVGEQAYRQAEQAHKGRAHGGRS
jgi:hypothetical protein